MLTQQNTYLLKARSIEQLPINPRSFTPVVYNQQRSVFNDIRSMQKDDISPQTYRLNQPESVKLHNNGKATTCYISIG